MPISDQEYGLPEYGPPELAKLFKVYVYESKNPIMSLFTKRKQKFRWVVVAPNGLAVAGNLEHLQSQDHAYKQAVKYFWWATIIVGQPPWA